MAVILDTITSAPGTWSDANWTYSLNQATAGLASITVDPSVSRSGRGAGAMRFDLTGDGTTSTYRCEASGDGGATSPSGTNRQITQGLERYVAFSVMAGDETTLGVLNGEVLCQIHGTESAWGFASPALLIYLHNGEFRITQRYDTVLDSLTTTAIKVHCDCAIGKAIKRQWFDFEIRLVPNHAGGVTQIMLDGRIVYQYSGPNSYNQTGFTHYVKFGIYAWRWRTVAPAAGSADARRVWYFDDVRIGDADSVFSDFDLLPRRVLVQPFFLL